MKPGEPPQTAVRWTILTGLALVLCTAPVRGDEAPCDLVIVGGEVVDGTGRQRFAADVAIRDGRIVAVGDSSALEAKKRIDGAGLIVCPGFIDLHSHAGRRLESGDVRYRRATNLVTQGITTVTLNADGSGPVATDRQRKALQAHPIGLNAVLMVGHNAVRRFAMKNDYRRTATQAELSQMKRLVQTAMEDGAFGLTAGLEYVPGIWSDTEELIALVDQIVPYGGAFIVHERSSGADPMWYLPSQYNPVQLTMLDNIAELITIGEKTGATVVATHIKARGTKFWGSSRVMVDMIERARARGVNIYADQYPYNSTGSDGRLVLVPDWLFEKSQGANRRSRSDDVVVDYATQLEEALADETTAAKAAKDVAHEISRRGGGANIIVMEATNKALEGRSLAELAAQREISEVETAFRLQIEGDRQRRGGVRLRSFSLSNQDVELFATQPWTATATDAGITLASDGPVHARFYGSFPRKIRHFAIERGLMTIEQAVRSATGLPAEILGLADRGQVREGFHADLVVFDPERIRDRATFAQPHQVCEGLVLVLVGGQAVVENDQPTGALPGVVLRANRMSTAD